MTATINIFTYPNKHGKYEASSPQILTIDPITGSTEEEAIQNFTKRIQNFFLDRRNTAIEVYNSTQDFYTITSIR